MAEKSLKEQNQRGLAALFLINAIVFVAVLKLPEMIAGEWALLWNDVKEIATGAALPFLIGILNGQVSADNKARLVFLRWRHPLPGSRAFTYFMLKDARVSPAAVEKTVGTLPGHPDDQNRTWFQLYLQVQNRPEVLDVHRQFLFARDYTTFSAMFLCAAVPTGFWLMRWSEAAGYSVVLVLQYLIAANAGRNYGQRFVTTVLAKSTGA